MRGLVFLTAASAALAVAASATDRPQRTDYVEIGAAFVDTCIKPAPDIATVHAAIAADSRWVASAVPADFRLKPASDAATLSAWRRTIDARDVLLVLIEDPTSKRLRNNCAFVFRNERPAIFFLRSVSDPVSKVYKARAVETDLPHQRLHKGKLATGESMEVELRSRSAALPGKDVIHIAAAF